ncbi:prolyl 3-hydroxylase OGFOD1 [Octopus bimaculoides]|uniref:uS12 prolyl 3-hydroxylase n=1 Tax=Octopus bimaculoides TaxID=37653 RepID=A0A0L8H7V0_OCTBM|nr:prolyl 3-hydroxylase OGFOD1 [Octopus bimaculoides]|eukprot:XP_014774688.1 PREDICTED: prolyl 3-hydroxylase OGFOD1-like [Octopus bimaculoides]
MSREKQVMAKRSVAEVSSEQAKPYKKKKRDCVTDEAKSLHGLSINPRYMKEDLIEYLRREFSSASAAASPTVRTCCTSANDTPIATTTTNNNSNTVTTTSNNNNYRSAEHSSPSCEKLIDPSPFVHCVLPEFITEDHCLDRLQGELQEVTFNEKNNDLYNFHQSYDLAQHTSPQITAFRKLFYTDVLEWMKKVTNVELTNAVDLFCSIYEYTDVLLCHDDELEGRRIAFILYLVPPWGPTDGGTLDLFTTNEVCQPTKVVKSVLPAWNQFTFFEVSPQSFHQVSEVLSKEKTRLSVSGWFHGPSLPRNPEAGQSSKLPLCPSLESETDLLFEWVNPSYLDLEVQSEIREKFELESEIQLQDFLKPEKYSAVNNAFLQSQIEWVHRGPANQRNYHVAANPGTFPKIIADCLRLLQSEILFLFLSNLTGLKLHKDAPVSDDDDEDNVSGGDDDGRHSPEGRNGKNNNNNNTNVQTDPQNSRVSAENRKNLGKSQKDGCSSRSSPEAVSVGLNDCPTTTASSPTSSSSGPAEQQPTKVTNTKTSKCSLPAVAGGASETVKAQPEKVTPDSSEASCSHEVRMWSHGSYTLLRDTEAKSADYALDTFLFFGCEGWQPDYGGYISYIVNGEDEELLTISPAHNSLALVYRDSETLRFVKHINHRITSMPNHKFFDISFIYYE